MTHPANDTIVTREFEGLSGPIRVHAIRTGEVSVKRGFMTAVGPNAVAKVSLILDSAFTPWLPIYAWVVEHPEGAFMVDTGENAQVSDPHYLDRAAAPLRWINHRTFKFRVAPEEEIGPQLARIGLQPRDIQRVLLTHLHIDHTDGLSYFPDSEILVHSGERKRPYADLPFLYPDWFKPTLFDFRKGAVEEFDGAFPVTRAEDVWIVSTPGHTPNHASVLLRGKSVDLLFAGDMVYQQDQLLGDVMAGAHANFGLAGKTYAAVKRYARRRPTVFLPAHDLAAADRLKALSALPV